jgi:hypothetical protein
MDVNGLMPANGLMSIGCELTVTLDGVVVVNADGGGEGVDPPEIPLLSLVGESEEAVMGTAPGTANLGKKD